MSKLLAWGLLILLAAPAMAATTWQKVVAPQFTLYSSGRSDETLRTAEELSQFVIALQHVIPADSRALPPLTVVLFGRDRDFRDFRPKRPNGKPWDVAGFFSRREGWAVFGLSTANFDDEVRHTVYHEAVHWFTSAFDVQNPPWLEEGLAEVFSTFAVEKKTANWGEAIGYHVAVLRARPLPLERLLAISHGDPLFNETNRTGEFYAGSWAFVHYLLFGKHGMPRTVLTDYLSLYRSALHPDDAFKKAFGADYGEMDRQLARYLDRGQYFKAKVDVTPLAKPLVIEPASDLEREIALTRLAIGAGQTALALTHANAARTLGPESAAASEALGYAAESADDKTMLLAAFTDAARQGSKDYRVYFVLGNEAHRAGTTHTGITLDQGGLSEIDAKGARRIANYYERTINLRPTFRPAYQNLGAIVELAEKAGATDRQFLEFGEKLYPDDGMIQLGLAILDRKLGLAEESRRRLEGVLNCTTPPPSHVASYARRIDDAWLYQDTRDRVQALASQEQYSAAVAEIDRVLATPIPPGMRSDLQINRRLFKASASMQAAKDAADNRDWGEVRRLLDEVIASDAPGPAKNAARRWLADLDKHNLRSK